MNEKQKINEFNDLFEKHDINQVPDIPKSNSPYFFSILYYLLIMLVVSTVIGLIFLGLNSTTTTLDQDQVAMQTVASDANGLTLIDNQAFQAYSDDYDSYVTSLGEYQSLQVIINVSNVTAMDYLMLEDDSLNTANLEAILNGSKTYWDSNDQYEITLYQSSLSSFNSTNANLQLIDEPLLSYTNLSNAIINFITYIALTPVLAFVLLRREITADILVYKKQWPSFISAVLIGYALALVGNFVANFLSIFISQLFGKMTATAANQMVIEQTLQSNGMILIFLSAVILGPIAEELIFRKSIFGLIKNDKLALVISALSFGVIHLMSETTITDAVINGVVYIALGFVFGYIYLRNKKNIAVNIAVHIVYNLVSVLMVLLLV